MEEVRYDGWRGEELARQLDVPRVALHAALGSTMDEAHRLAAEGAPAGTLVLADRQTSGRGRGGRTWSSPPGAGLWMTLIERPTDLSALDVLSLRTGLRAAAALDRFAGERIHLKWPNDLMLGDGKLAGILTEVRWRDTRAEWVAIGIGVNLVPPPGVERAASLGPGVARVEVLAELLPALRAAARGVGPLGAAEMDLFAARDWAHGRRARAPQAGVIRGISPTGALLVESGETVHACTSGSLILEGLVP